MLPIVDIDDPVIADDYADPAFGTGVVKITPAHDANDFEVGKRHTLPMPVVIDEHGVVREVTDADGRVPARAAAASIASRRATRIVEMLRDVGRARRRSSRTSTPCGTATAATRWSSRACPISGS